MTIIVESVHNRVTQYIQLKEGNQIYCLLIYFGNKQTCK